MSVSCRTLSYYVPGAPECRLRPRLESKRPDPRAFFASPRPRTFSPTSSQATASGDQTIKLWDSETQACVGVLVGHTCTIKNVAFDPFNSSSYIFVRRVADGSLTCLPLRSSLDRVSRRQHPRLGSSDTRNRLCASHHAWLPGYLDGTLDRNRQLHPQCSWSKGEDLSRGGLSSLLREAS